MRRRPVTRPAAARFPWAGLSDEENDEDFDALEAEALARVRAAEERIRRTPPRCLDGFVVHPAPPLDFALDGHGEELNKVFRLSCKCSGRLHKVLGHLGKTMYGDSIFVSPLALECVACGAVTEVFDSAVHGYDPEVCGHDTSLRGSGARQHFACDRCGIAPARIHARFEHSSEVLDDSTGEFTGNEHNLFTWFTLVDECTGCGRLLTIAAFECA